jgi:uncharacterized protein DUF4202
MVSICNKLRSVFLDLLSDMISSRALHCARAGAGAVAGIGIVSCGVQAYKVLCWRGKILESQHGQTGAIPVNDKLLFAGKLSDPARFRRAIDRFDEHNSDDPNQEVLEGVAVPRELLYAQRLSSWVLKLCADASEELRLASRCQHLCRWKIPRHSYPMTRLGYLRWRTELKSFHAQLAGEILHEVGYPESVIARVQALNLKQDFPADPDSRVLEDALCLVFLQYQLADLAHKTADEKMINALQKSWRKMTPQAQAYAFELPYGEKERSLIDRALAKRQQ